MNVSKSEDRNRQSTPTRLLVMAGLVAIGLCSCRSTDSRFADHRTHHAPLPPRHGAGASGNGQVAVPPALNHGAAIVQAGYSQPAAAGQVIPVAAASQMPHDPRYLTEQQRQALFPDEYLFDGGDRDKPIHYDAFRRLGVDTEDTIAEYNDSRGVRKVKATNRVAVYAPRFSAVRTVSQVVQGVGGRNAVGLETGTHVAGFRARTATLNHKQRAVPDGVRMRARGSGIDSDQREVTGRHITRLAAHQRRVTPMENFTFIQTGRLVRTEEAAIALGIQAAAVWSKKQFPVAMASSREAGEVSAKAKYQEYVGLESMLKVPGKLRIVKLADKKEAKPGDIITFTIRYDNLGELPLSGIRIIDNLTPRLQYVDDSGQSDRAGRLVIEDNLEGSIVLKFEMPDPLPGGKGGVVTFKAKVR